MVSAIYPCAYFPNIAYVSSMLYQDEILIEGRENYIRQSYRSRCFINGANGILPLIVPVEKGRSKTLIKDIKINKNSTWHDQHFKSILSAYGKAPFYDHYNDEIHSFLFRDHSFLFDLCIESLTLCLRLMNINITWKETENFFHEYHTDTKDFRNVFDAKRPDIYPDFYKPQRYFQLFGRQFVGNLSVLDLIFCNGPEAVSILKRSFKEGV